MHVINIEITPAKYFVLPFTIFNTFQSMYEALPKPAMNLIESSVKTI